MNKNIMKFIIISIIIIFLVSYLVASTGYYEYQIQERTILTNEKIKEFEEDIKNNKDIDALEYFTLEEVDYSNKFTNLVYNISNESTKVTRKVIKKIFKKLGSLVEE